MVNKFKALDFFCGGGGMTYGLKQSGIDVIAGIDLELNCKETYELNNLGSTFVHADITKLPLAYFEKHFNITKNDDYLVLVGCSPCQYYSLINSSKEKSKKSKDLLLDFQKFIKYYNPGYVLVENVPGIVTNKESVLPKFLAFLEKFGYKYIKYDVVNMSDYGVPQTRRRFSLIASRIDDIDLPIADNKKAILKDFIGVKNGFPKIKAGHKDYSDFNHSVAGLSEKSIKRLEKTPQDGGDRLAWKDDDELQLECFKGKDHHFKDTFGRMFWDKPGSTITTKFFSISNGRFAHPEENRAISIREGATLQTFPKNYIFKTNSMAETAKLIGNAVPPEYAKRLGKVITKRK